MARREATYLRSTPPLRFVAKTICHTSSNASVTGIGLLSGDYIAAYDSRVYMCACVCVFSTVRSSSDDPRNFRSTDCVAKSEDDVQTDLPLILRLKICCLKLVGTESRLWTKPVHENVHENHREMTNSRKASEEFDEESVDSGVISQESTTGSRALMVANPHRLTDVRSTQVEVAQAPLLISRLFPSADREVGKEVLEDSYAAKQNAIVVRADVLCEVETRVKSPDNEHLKKTDARHLHDGPTGVDSAVDKSRSGFEEKTKDSRDQPKVGGDRERSCVEELFTMRKVSEEEEQQLLSSCDVIQVRCDSDADALPDDSDD